jgi:hypothetical protein
MKKTLVFLILSAMLLSSGVTPQSGAAWQGGVTSEKNTGVRLAVQEGQASAIPADIKAQMNLLYPGD